jgi:hypothetical protein
VLSLTTLEDRVRKKADRPGVLGNQVLPGVRATLAPGRNPGLATLYGSVALTGSGGTASFPALWLNKPGRGCILVARAGVGAAKNPVRRYPSGRLPPG